MSEIPQKLAVYFSKLAHVCPEASDETRLFEKSVAPLAMKVALDASIPLHGAYVLVFEIYSFFWLAADTRLGHLVLMPQ